MVCCFVVYLFIAVVDTKMRLLTVVYLYIFLLYYVLSQTCDTGTLFVGCSAVLGWF